MLFGCEHNMSRGDIENMRFINSPLRESGESDASYDSRRDEWQYELEQEQEDKNDI